MSTGFENIFCRFNIAINLLNTFETKKTGYNNGYIVLLQISPKRNPLLYLLTNYYGRIKLADFSLTTTDLKTFNNLLNLPVLNLF
jgi:hypothetical protein